MKFLDRLVSHENLSKEEIFALFENIKEGHLNDSQMAAFIVAMQMTDVTDNMLSLMVQALRSQSNHALMEAIDISSLDTPFTLIASLIAKDMGLPICSAVFRSLNSQMGSYDLVESMGMSSNSICNPNQHLSAVKNTLSVRKSLGFTSYFDAATILSHPFKVKGQSLFVQDESLMEKMAGALQLLGDSNVLILGEKRAIHIKGNQRLSFDVSIDFPKERLSLIQTVQIFDELMSGKENIYLNLVLSLVAGAIYLERGESFENALILAREAFQKNPITL